jgi:hypothetical protein
MDRKDLTAKQTEVPGQVTLPGMVGEIGYESTKLDSRREKFCWEYVLNGGYASRAYRLAYPDCTSKSGSEANASRLLKTPKIHARINEVREEIKRRYRATTDDILEYHGKVLKIDRREFIDEKGKPKKITDIDSAAASILEFDCERDPKNGNVYVKMKVPARHQSAVELGKIMGMNKENVKIEGGMKIDSVSGVATDAERFDLLRARLRVMRDSIKEEGESHFTNN